MSCRIIDEAWPPCIVYNHNKQLKSFKLAENGAFTFRAATLLSVAQEGDGTADEDERP